MHVLILDSANGPANGTERNQCSKENGVNLPSSTANKRARRKGVRHGARRDEYEDGELHDATTKDEEMRRVAWCWQGTAGTKANFLWGKDTTSTDLE
jgi:hypothetical protein